MVLDHRTCRLCVFTLCLEVHHIVPVSEGGSDKLPNLITLCPNHHAMADRGLIPIDVLMNGVAARTSIGRKKLLFDLVESVAKQCLKAGDDPAELQALKRSLKAQILEQMARIRGAEQLSALESMFSTAAFTANPDSSLPISGDDGGCMYTSVLADSRWLGDAPVKDSGL